MRKGSGGNGVGGFCGFSVEWNTGDGCGKKKRVTGTETVGGGYFFDGSTVAFVFCASCFADSVLHPLGVAGMWPAAASVRLFMFSGHAGSCHYGGMDCSVVPGAGNHVPGIGRAGECTVVHWG